MRRPSLVRVREALEASWDATTSYQGVHDPDRPSLGQCYPTSRVLQSLRPELEIVEGVVWTGRSEEVHFWTVLATDTHIDLTWQQFPHGSVVRSWQRRDRDTLGDGPATLDRVERLERRVRAHLGDRR